MKKLAVDVEKPLYHNLEEVSVYLHCRKKLTIYVFASQLITLTIQKIG